MIRFLGCICRIIPKLMFNKIQQIALPERVLFFGKPYNEQRIMLNFLMNNIVVAGMVNKPLVWVGRQLPFGTGIVERNIKFNQTIDRPIHS